MCLFRLSSKPTVPDIPLSIGRVPVKTQQWQRREKQTDAFGHDIALSPPVQWTWASVFSHRMQMILLWKKEGVSFCEQTPQTNTTQHNSCGEQTGYYWTNMIRNYENGQSQRQQFSNYSQWAGLVSLQMRCYCSAKEPPNNIWKKGNPSVSAPQWGGKSLGVPFITFCGQNGWCAQIVSCLMVKLHNKRDHC